MRLWVVATNTAPEKQGPAITLALGGEARRVAEEIRLIYRQVGTNDPVTGEWVSGPELIGRALIVEFPENPEAQMLRTGIEFFSFCPKPGEQLEVLHLRFDRMINAAAEGRGLAFSWQMRACMFLCILRLPDKRWADVSKDNNHVLPHTEEQYKEVKKRLLREKTLEYTLHSLGSQSHRTPGGSCNFWPVKPGLCHCICASLVQRLTNTLGNRHTQCYLTDGP